MLNRDLKEEVSERKSRTMENSNGLLLLSASAVNFLRRKILSNSVSLFSGSRDFKLLELVDLLSVP